MGAKTPAPKWTCPRCLMVFRIRDLKPGIGETGICRVPNCGQRFTATIGGRNARETRVISYISPEDSPCSN